MHVAVITYNLRPSVALSVGDAVYFGKEVGLLFSQLHGRLTTLVRPLNLFHVLSFLNRGIRGGGERGRERGGRER